MEVMQMKEYLRKNLLLICNKIRYSLLSNNDKKNEFRLRADSMKFSPDSRLHDIVSKIGMQDYLYIRSLDK